MPILKGALIDSTDVTSTACPLRCPMRLFNGDTDRNLVQAMV